MRSDRIRKGAAVALALLAGALVWSPTTPGAAIPAGEHMVIGTASIAPLGLPRSEAAPATLRVGFRSGLTSGSTTPELSSVALEISDRVTFRTAGLPSCPLANLFSAYRSARQSCADSLVGHGSVTSEIAVPGEPPAVVHGRMSAFYNEEVLGSEESVPHILAQVTTGGEDPLTYVLPFRIQSAVRPFGTSLVIPRMRRIHGKPIYGGAYNFNGIYGHISAFKLSLHRLFAHGGKTESFVSADCPAGGNRSRAIFPLMRLDLAYADESVVSGTVSGACKVTASMR